MDKAGDDCAWKSVGCGGFMGDLAVLARNQLIYNALLCFIDLYSSLVINY